MKSKKNITLCLLSVVITAQAEIAKLDFIDNKFEDFLTRLHISSSKEREEFGSYYSSVCSKLKETEEVKKRVAEGYLYKIALEGMQKKHPAWHKALEPFISDPRITLDTEINNVRLFIGGFLLRYGAYEEFIHVKNKSVPQQDGFLTSLWKNVKNYTVAAKNTVTGWFIA